MWSHYAHGSSDVFHGEFDSDGGAGYHMNSQISSFIISDASNQFNQHVYSPSLVSATKLNTVQNDTAY